MADIQRNIEKKGLSGLAIPLIVGVFVFVLLSFYGVDSETSVYQNALVLDMVPPYTLNVEYTLESGKIGQYSKDVRDYNYTLVNNAFDTVRVEIEKTGYATINKTIEWDLIKESESNWVLDMSGGLYKQKVGVDFSLTSLKLILSLIAAGVVLYAMNRK